MTKKCQEYYALSCRLKTVNDGLKQRNAIITEEREILIDMLRKQKHKLKFYTHTEKEKDVALIKRKLKAIINNDVDDTVVDYKKNKKSPDDDFDKPEISEDEITILTEEDDTNEDMVELQELDNDYEVTDSSNKLHGFNRDVNIKERIEELSKRKSAAFAAKKHVKTDTKMNDKQKIFDFLNRVSELEDEKETIDLADSDEDNEINDEISENETEDSTDSKESAESKDISIGSTEIGQLDKVTKPMFKEIDQILNIVQNNLSDAEEKVSFSENQANLPAAGKEDVMRTSPQLNVLKSETEPEIVAKQEKLVEDETEELLIEKKSRECVSTSFYDTDMMKSDPEENDKVTKTELEPFVTTNKRKNMPENETNGSNKKKMPKNNSKCKKCLGLCSGFLRADCEAASEAARLRACKACLDKPRNGGKNTLRRKCDQRKCTDNDMVSMAIDY